MQTKSEIISVLNSMANAENVIYREKKFGVVTKNALGISMKQLNELCKEIKGSKALAVDLFNSDIYECKILCAKLLKPKDVTDALAEEWLNHFDNWEITDTFCMGLIAKSSIATNKILEWSEHEHEFKKRASFATLAAYCMANKTSTNKHFLPFLSIISKQATDNRLYVKKAVNWALRSIGKRNKELKVEALNLSYQLLEIDSAAARWIAKDAIRELENPKTRSSDYPRKIYRP